MQTAFAKHVRVWSSCGLRPAVLTRQYSHGSTGCQKRVAAIPLRPDAAKPRRLCSASRANSNPVDALTETLGGISEVEGRAATGNKLVLGGDDSLEKWRELDAKVNKYPTKRVFKAIGSGGDDFVSSMVAAVKCATNAPDVPASSRPSAKGNYISATLGPVMMQNSEQVVEVYQRMREDNRLKWYL